MKDPFFQYFLSFLQTARQGTVAFLQAQQNEDLVEIYDHHLNWIAQGRLVTSLSTTDEKN